MICTYYSWEGKTGWGQGVALEAHVLYDREKPYTLGLQTLSPTTTQSGFHCFALYFVRFFLLLGLLFYLGPPGMRLKGLFHVLAGGWLVETRCKRKNDVDNIDWFKKVTVDELKNS
jgi:hypothetical protein